MMIGTVFGDKDLNAFSIKYALHSFFFADNQINCLIKLTFKRTQMNALKTWMGVVHNSGFFPLCVELYSTYFFFTL